MVVPRSINSTSKMPLASQKTVAINFLAEKDWRAFFGLLGEANARSHDALPCTARSVLNGCAHRCENGGATPTTYRATPKRRLLYGRPSYDEELANLTTELLCLKFAFDEGRLRRK
ncbi:hypothetical protein J6590_006944 [Homalodisca vitripennis]|nr:hypothetical protein J6590_006944 [Homalodisca vitripennis]